MAWKLWPNGLGSSLGAELVTDSPLYTSGDVWWVDSATGSDGSGNTGKERRRPLATLSQAVTNSGAGDIIVLMDGHEETITSTIQLASRTIVGEGKSDGKPTVKLTNNQSADEMFDIYSSGIVQLFNIWFEEQAQACSAPKILCDGFTTSVLRIQDCYFECDENDDVPSVYVNGDFFSLDIRNTTFIANATDATDTPATGVGVGSSGNITNITLDGVVFDGGEYGWGSPQPISGFAYYEDDGASVDNLLAVNISLLRGADMRIESSTNGYISPTTSTGGAKIEFESGGGA